MTIGCYSAQSGATVLHYVVLPCYTNWCYRATLTGATVLHYLVLPCYTIWCYRATLSGATVLHYLVLPCYTIWCYRATLSGATVLHYLVLPLTLRSSLKKSLIPLGLWPSLTLRSSSPAPNTAEKKVYDRTSCFIII